MEEKDVLEIFENTEALLEGHFLLSSGLHSSQYFQCAKVLQYPQYAEELAEDIAARFQDVDADFVWSEQCNIAYTILVEEIQKAMPNVRRCRNTGFSLYVKADIFCEPLMFTIDTGSERTMISKRVYDRIDPESRPKLRECNAGCTVNETPASDNSPFPSLCSERYTFCLP